MASDQLRKLEAGQAKWLRLISRGLLLAGLALLIMGLLLWNGQIVVYGVLGVVFAGVNYVYARILARFNKA